MIRDKELLFSDAQDISGSVTPAASTNLVDLGSERYIGTGREINLVVQLDEALTDSGSNSTVAVIVQSDTDVAFGSPTTYLTVGTFAATSAIGARFIIRLPQDVANERYLRLVYTIAGGDLSTGKVSAFLVTDIQAYRAYADDTIIS